MESWDLSLIDIRPHQPKVLRSDPEARLIAINLPSGEELGEHQVHERAYLFVAEGEIECEQGGESQTGGPGFLVHWDANTRHSVRAKTDARVLLILAPWTGEGHSRDRAGGAG